MKRKHNRLSKAAVRSIRKVYSTGNFTQYEIAEFYGTCQSNVHYIVNHYTH